MYEDEFTSWRNVTTDDVSGATQTAKNRCFATQRLLMRLVQHLATIHLIAASARIYWPTALNDN